MKKQLIAHPYLFAVFPVIFLFAHNIGELELYVVIEPLLGMVLIAFGLLFLSRLIFKDREKAAFFVSIFLLLFFSYGLFSHIWRVTFLNIGGFKIGPGKIVIFLDGILYFLAYRFILRLRNNLEELTMILNVVALSLVMISLPRIGLSILNNRGVALENIEYQNAVTDAAASKKAAKPPNIYYIILDGYARADILDEVYKYDNARFLEYLKGKDFYVAGKSRSNYHSTSYSIASSLNLSYLDDATNALHFLGRNRVFSFLKGQGYTTVFISSSDSDMALKKADFYLRYRRWWNDFQNELINLTPISALLDKVSLFHTNELHRERINRVFDLLGDVPKFNSPFFIFAYIYAPHPPFVFGPDGESIQPGRKYCEADGEVFIRMGGTRDEYLSGYKGQIQYINKRLMRAIDQILSKEKVPPIIIVQGDHGPRSMVDWNDLDKTYWKEPYSILNAYYLPGGGSNLLYSSITPVNTFRVVFNYYFGTRYGMLEDRNYFVDKKSTKEPRRPIDVTDRIDNANPGK